MDHEANMIGGGFNAFGNNTGKFYLLGMVGGVQKVVLTEKYQEAFNENPDPKKPFHLTLLQLDINKQSPFDNFLKTVIQDPEFHNGLKNIYESTLKKINLVAQSYKEMGDFVAIEYSPDYQNTITEFRTGFYRLLEAYYLQKNRSGIDKTQSNINVSDSKDPNQTLGYRIFIDQKSGDPLYAVPEWYYGVGKWTPHLSIAHKSIGAKRNENQQKMIRNFQQAQSTNDERSIHKLSGQNFEKIRLSYSYGTFKSPQQVSVDVELKSINLLQQKLEQSLQQPNLQQPQLQQQQLQQPQPAQAQKQKNVVLKRILREERDRLNIDR